MLPPELVGLLKLDPHDHLLLRDLHLLTDKPVMYVANVDESGFTNNPRLDRVREIAAGEGAIVVPICAAIEAEIRDRGVAPRRFLGRKGDVLIWHGRLMHRGTQPVRTDLERRALIAHYSGISHRPDMPRRETDKSGGVYAVFDHKLI